VAAKALYLVAATACRLVAWVGDRIGKDPYAPRDALIADLIALRPGPRLGSTGRWTRPAP
jgi:hypothetical protein